MPDLSNLWSFLCDAPETAGERTLFVPAFANAASFETDEGLVLVDCGAPHTGALIRGAIRERTTAPLHTVVFTHGHLDHAFGLGPWLAEGKPRVVAHAAIVQRFERYAKTGALNEHINRIQFGVERVDWPREFYWPDMLYEDALELVVGGETFELRHGRGETDDATWVWVPSRKVLCTGDFWISCAPNCGNPQKVQRYAEDWATTLEAMAELGAEYLLPGHGPMIQGAAVVRGALLDVAAYLRSLVAQTLAGLNAGLPHEEIVLRVAVPPDLAAKPHLAPLYDRPEFIVRNVIRLHSGWWDGFPANLLPAPPTARATEIARLAGGVDRLVARARELANTDLALACHLAEWATLADPSSAAAQSVALDLFTLRVDRESSLMGKGIFKHAVRTAEKALASGGNRSS